jgi:hypothetical protein
VRLRTGARSTLGKLAAFVHVQFRIIELLLRSASRCSYRRAPRPRLAYATQFGTLHSAFSSAYASQPPCSALHWASRKLSPSLLTASKMAKRPFSLRHLLSRDGAAIHKKFGNAQEPALAGVATNHCCPERKLTLQYWLATNADNELTLCSALVRGADAMSRCTPPYSELESSIMDREAECPTKDVSHFRHVWRQLELICFRSDVVLFRGGYLVASQVHDSGYRPYVIRNLHNLTSLPLPLLLPPYPDSLIPISLRAIYTQSITQTSDNIHPAQNGSEEPRKTAGGRGATLLELSASPGRCYA